VGKLRVVALNRVGKRQVVAWSQGGKLRVVAWYLEGSQRVGNLLDDHNLEPTFVEKQPS